MSTTKAIGVTGALVLGLVAVLVGAAIYLADQHTDLLQMLLKDDSSSSSDSSDSGMELHGHWNGVDLAPVTSRRAAAAGVPAGDRRGVAVVDIDSRFGARAQASGIRVGDVIVGVDQTPVNNLVDLYKKSRSVAQGTPVLLDVRRQGQDMSFAVLMAPPDVGVTTALGAPGSSGPQFCPRDGVLVPAAQAARTPSCPVCGGPLMTYPPAR